MRFIRRGAGHVTATSKAGDLIEIRKVGKDWKLTIFEEMTFLPMLTHTADRQFKCCQEACRYFGVGAYADPGAS